MTDLQPQMVRRDLRLLQRLPVNARFMDQSTYQRLVANIRRDGCLTSVPLIWQSDQDGYPEGSELILSGNHRCDAAVDAEVYEDDCKLVTGPLSKARRVAMQLSHNSLAGGDDAATLAQLYEDIDDVDWRDYAGLDDKTLQLLDRVELESLSEAALDYTTVQLVFLPPEKQAAADALGNAKLSADETWLAARGDYETVLDALASTQAANNVGNVATALHLVLAVFERHLGDLREGWLDSDDALEPRHNGNVGLETVFGSRTMPAKSAAILNRAVRRAVENGDVEAGKEWGLLERLADAYLTGLSVDDAARNH